MEDLIKIKEALEVFARVGKVVKDPSAGLWCMSGGEHDGLGIKVKDCIKAQEALTLLNKHIDRLDSEKFKTEMIKAISEAGRYTVEEYDNGSYITAGLDEEISKKCAQAAIKTIKGE